MPDEEPLLEPDEEPLLELLLEVLPLEELVEPEEELLLEVVSSSPPPPPPPQAVTRSANAMVAVQDAIDLVCFMFAPLRD